jgi:hypothetical protein
MYQSINHQVNYVPGLVRRKVGSLTENEFNSVLPVYKYNLHYNQGTVVHCILKIIPHKFHPQQLSRSYCLYLPPISSCLILFLLLQKDSLLIIFLLSPYVLTTNHAFLNVVPPTIQEHYRIQVQVSVSSSVTL